MTTSTPANGMFSDKPVVLKGHSLSTLSVAFSPFDQLLASGSSDDTIRLWNVISGASIATLRSHSKSVCSLAFSPDGTVLASGSSDMTIKLWDVGSRAEIATLGGRLGDVFSVTFSPDGASLASGSKDRTVRLWDVKSRTSISVLEGHTDSVRSVAFSPDGERVASGSQDGTIRLWDVASGAIIGGWDSLSIVVLSIAFSPDGEHLASGSVDNVTRLWDAATGDLITTLEGHSHMVTSVVFTPDGKHLASGSADQTIRFYDLVSRSNVSTLKYPKGVGSIALSCDGSRLAVASCDRIVRVWKVFSEVEESLSAISTSNWVGSTQSTTYSQQNSGTSASASMTLSNDITGSVSLGSSNLIGYGGFGELFLGVHKVHGKVALKKPRRLIDEALVRRFLREVDLWCSVSHQYILPCLGMCRVGPDVYVVSPFIENGDLLSCMNRGKDLNRSKLLFEVVEALTHLHHRGIVHGDIKAQNILLGDDGSALLCDFGLAKAFNTMVTSTEAKGAGSVRWMAPELFQDESRSMASDVFSLGITIAEVLSGRAPYHDISDNLAVMLHVAYHDGRPAKEPLSSPEGKSYGTLWETAEKCWVKDTKARPSMAQVLAMLFPLTQE